AAGRPSGVSFARASGRRLIIPSLIPCQGQRWDLAFTNSTPTIHRIFVENLPWTHVREPNFHPCKNVRNSPYFEAKDRKAQPRLPFSAHRYRFGTLRTGAPFAQ